jgi:hypothetical protein
MAEFDIRDDETFSDWKRRKGEEKGLNGLGQKNVKDKSQWSENQKRGLRNKQKGRRKQNLARKKLKLPDTKFRSLMGNEESWGGLVRVEVKAGKQIQPIWTKYLKAKEQSDKNVAIGDNRPFLFVAMPDGVSNGLVIIELDELENSIIALLETWNQENI